MEQAEKIITSCDMPPAFCDQPVSQIVILRMGGTADTNIEY